MRYKIITYGCQMNESDSERIAAVLEKSGCRPSASEEEAGLVVLNACSVRQKAVDRIHGKIKQLKITNCGLRIILTGCILPEDKKKLENKVDLIFDIKDLPKLPRLLKKIRNPQLAICNSKRQSETSDYFEIKPHYTDESAAYVPIMTGCDNFCSYCVVPYTRGREKSRKAQEIIAEIKTLVKNKRREIMLLGQNVNSYRAGSVDFPKLLRLINALPGNFQIQFMTAHPKDMNDETIKVLRLPKISGYLHLPVQAGSNRILKLMNRHYTAATYLRLIEKIRLTRPDIEIGTDIIVGFPGETRDDFRKTIALCKKAKFANAYIARYSPRPGTVAAKTLKDDVTPKEKKRRWLILEKLINKKSAERRP